MKKVIGIILVVVFVLSLTACGKNKDDENMVLVNGEYVSEKEAAALEKAN